MKIAPCIYLASSHPLPKSITRTLNIYEKVRTSTNIAPRIYLASSLFHLPYTEKCHRTLNIYEKVQKTYLASHDYSAPPMRKSTIER